VIPVATAEEVRQLDRRVIEGLGLPGIALMEVASASVARAVRRHHEAAARRGVVVLTGGGNNGGDGWAVARWLHGWGFDVRVWPVSAPKTDDARAMASVCRAAGIPEGTGLADVGLVVDAVLGTGLSSEVRGAARDVLEAVVAWGGEVVAVDLPSGLHADTGQALGPVPRAARTVTFGRAKRGMYAGEGPDLVGRIEVTDIGLGVATPATGLRTAALLTEADVPWPVRPAAAHKGTSGHLAVVAGSEAMAGAAVLCCLGALAGGAGKVTLVTAAGAVPRLGALPPEVMLSLQRGQRLGALPDLSWADAVVAGPGLGGGQPLSSELGDALEALWREGDRPVVYDADALACARGGTGPRVVTPHPGEAGRMLGSTAARVQSDRYGAARSLVGVAGATTLLKGRLTLVDDGELVTINPSGSAALATGGTGDVLAGMLGALLARGASPVHAARTAAYWHGRAGEALPATGSASQLPEALASTLAAAGRGDRAESSPAT